MSPEDNAPIDGTREAQPVDMRTDPRTLTAEDGTRSVDPQQFWTELFANPRARAKLVECPELGVDPYDPEFGVRIEVRSMSAGERSNYYAALLNATDEQGRTTDLAALYRAAVASSARIPRYNDKGEWLPGKSDTRLVPVGKEAMLLDLDAAAVQRLFEASNELAGTDPEEEKAMFPETGE